MLRLSILPSSWTSAHLSGRGDLTATACNEFISDPNLQMLLMPKPNVEAAAADSSDSKQRGRRGSRKQKGGQQPQPHEAQAPGQRPPPQPPQQGQPAGEGTLYWWKSDLSTGNSSHVIECLVEVVQASRMGEWLFLLHSQM